MDLVLLVLLLLAMGVLIWLVVKNRPLSEDNKEDVQKLQIELAQAQAQVQAQAQERERLSERFLEERAQLQANLDEKQNEILELNKRLERSREFFKAQEEKIKEYQAFYEKARTDFENLSTKLFEEKSQKFNEQTRLSLDTVFNPLKERIKEFEEKVDKAYKSEAAERNVLKGSIDQMMNLHKQMSVEAQRLTNALKGDNKSQGNWGELMLEKILDGSGLIKGENYILQASLKDDEGKDYRPDAMILLPDNKNIIVDSKVSLTAYERMVNAETETERQENLLLHIRSIKTHIDLLSRKDYYNLRKNNTRVDAPDFVLLFMAIESSFAMAVQEDRELFEYAWSKKVVIVTPSTLLATLKTIASIWLQEKQTRNAMEIAEKAGQLYDKFVGFTADLEKIGKGIDASRVAYDEAFKKLSNGSGNLVGRVENLRRLGARNTKQIDEKFLFNSSEEE